MGRCSRMVAQLPVCPDCQCTLSLEPATCDPCKLKFSLSLEVGPSGAEANAHAQLLEAQGIVLPMPADQLASLLERSPARVGARQNEVVVSAAMAQLQAQGAPVRWIVRKLPGETPTAQASQDPDRGKSDLTVIREAVRNQGSSEAQVQRTLECAGGFYGANAALFCVVAVIAAFTSFSHALSYCATVVFFGLTAGLLPQRRSRALALLLFVWPLLEALLSVDYFWLGDQLNSKDIFFNDFEPTSSLVFLPLSSSVGLVAVRATFAHHKRRRSIIVWENVITTLLVALGWVLGVGFVGFMAMVRLGLYESELAYTALFLAMFGVFVLCLVGGVLKGTEDPRPFVRSDLEPDLPATPEPFERLKGRQVWVAIVAGLGALSGLISLLV